MNYSRFDYSGSTADEIFKNYNENLKSNTDGQLNISELISAKYNNSKGSTQVYLDDLKKRTGLTEYLNKRKASQKYQSLIDVPKIKDSVDKAILNKQFDNAVNLLNSLQGIVSMDPDISEDLKGVFMDVRLVDYVGKGIDKIRPSSDIDYTLRPRENADIKTQTNTPYFNFTQNEYEQQR